MSSGLFSRALSLGLVTGIHVPSGSEGKSSRGNVVADRSATERLPVLPPVRAVDGRHVTIPVPGAKLTVVALVGETCPLSRKLGPTYTQLEARFRKQGVRVVYVNPSEIETAEETKHWA